MGREEWEAIIAKIIKDANLNSLKLEYWTKEADGCDYLCKVSMEKEYC